MALSTQVSRHHFLRDPHDGFVGRGVAGDWELGAEEEDLRTSRAPKGLAVGSRQAVISSLCDFCEERCLGIVVKVACIIGWMLLSIACSRTDRTKAPVAR